VNKPWIPVDNFTPDSEPGCPIPQSEIVEVFEYIDNELTSKGIEATSKNLLEAARDKDSPLHKYFEWDDSIAAENWRLRQAGQLSHRVVTGMANPETEEVTKTPLFYKLPPLPQDTDNGDENTKPEKVLVHLKDVMSNEYHRANAIEQGAIALHGWAKRYRLYSEFDAVVEAIDGLDAE